MQSALGTGEHFWHSTTKPPGGAELELRRVDFAGVVVFPPVFAVAPAAGVLRQLGRVEPMVFLRRGHDQADSRFPIFARVVHGPGQLDGAGIPTTRRSRENLRSAAGDRRQVGGLQRIVDQLNPALLSSRLGSEPQSGTTARRGGNTG